MIVVGFDGGLPSRRALGWAVRRVAPGGRIVLVTATRPEAGTLGRPGLDMVVSDPLHHARLALDEITLDDPMPAIEAVVIDDTPAHALATFARDRGADEIVVGGPPGRAEGQVATDLLFIADRPVVVVR